MKVVTLLACIVIGGAITGIIDSSMGFTYTDISDAICIVHVAIHVGWGVLLGLLWCKIYPRKTSV